VYKRQEYPSRVQMAWARYFDEHGIAYQAEPTWFSPDLGDGVWYRPDFWLPQSRHWVEVKAGQDQVDTVAEFKCRKLSDRSGYDVQLVVGYPDQHRSFWYSAHRQGRRVA
jgi:hypothetical protein